MTDSKADLGHEKIGKLLFSMAFPAITAQIINVLYNIVDRMYIGHISEIGTDALTGVGITFPIIMLISAFSSLIGMGGAPQAAIRMGKGDNKSAEKIIGSCAAALIAISIMLTTIIFIFQNKLLMFFGASENTIKYAMDYMRIYCLGTIFIQIVLGLNPFITTQGFASVGMKTTVIGAVLNIILDPIFIWGLGLNVKGAATATVISQAVSAIWVLKFLTGQKTTLKIKKENLKLDTKIISGVVALGISPFIMQSTESILTICFNTSLQKYGGDIAVGSMTILSSCMQFTLLPLTGLTQGAQPIVSFNYGAGNKQRVTDVFRLLICLSLAYTIIFWAVAMFVPNIFISLFTNNAQLMSAASWSMRVYMASSLLFGAQIACQQTFIALGEAKISVFLAVLRKIILLIPLIFIFPAVLPENQLMRMIPPTVANLFPNASKTFCVFLAEPVSDAIAVAVTVIMFKLNYKKILDRIPTPYQKQQI
ncbi:MAG: MATE family efflux transporter [Firmicutes bacterium]|nr:MATE family efflux transporter [Bacillota bacterium]